MISFLIVHAARVAGEQNRALEADAYRTFNFNENKHTPVTDFMTRRHVGVRCCSSSSSSDVNAQATCVSMCNSQAQSGRYSYDEMGNLCARHGLTLCTETMLKQICVRGAGQRTCGGCVNSGCNYEGSEVFVLNEVAAKREAMMKVSASPTREDQGSEEANAAEHSTAKQLKGPLERAESDSSDTGGNEDRGTENGSDDDTESGRQHTQNGSDDDTESGRQLTQNGSGDDTESGRQHAQNGSEDTSGAESGKAMMRTVRAETSEDEDPGTTTVTTTSVPRTCRTYNHKNNVTKRWWPSECNERRPVGLRCCDELQQTCTSRCTPLTQNLTYLEALDMCANLAGDVSRTLCTLDMIIKTPTDPGNTNVVYSAPNGCLHSTDCDLESVDVYVLRPEDEPYIPTTTTTTTTTIFRDVCETFNPETGEPATHECDEEISVASRCCFLNINGEERCGAPCMLPGQRSPTVKSMTYKEALNQCKQLGTQVMERLNTGVNERNKMTVERKYTLCSTDILGKNCTAKKDHISRFECDGCAGWGCPNVDGTVDEDVDLNVDIWVRHSNDTLHTHALHNDNGNNGQNQENSGTSLVQLDVTGQEDKVEEQRENPAENDDKPKRMAEPTSVRKDGHGHQPKPERNDDHTHTQAHQPKVDDENNDERQPKPSPVFEPKLKQQHGQVHMHTRDPEHDEHDPRQDEHGLNHDEHEHERDHVHMHTRDPKHDEQDPVQDEHDEHDHEREHDHDHGHGHKNMHEHEHKKEPVLATWSFGAKLRTGGAELQP